MAIIRTVNPIDDQPLVMVKGVIDQISFKEIPGGDKYQNTHRASLRIGDDWINNITLKVKGDYEPSLRVNTGSNANPDWKAIEVGDEVKVVVTESEYNGKVYMNSGSSKITLVKKGTGTASPAQQKPQNASGGSSYSKKDDTPIVAGNARTAAATWLARQDDGDLSDLIKFFAKVSHDARLKLKEQHPDMSDFDVGIGSGQGTVVAAQLCESLEDVEQFIIDFVNEVVPFSVQVVKDLNAPKEESKPKATKSVSKTATKTKKEPVAPADLDDDVPNDDSDLPF